MASLPSHPSPSSSSDVEEEDHQPRAKAARLEARPAEGSSLGSVGSNSSMVGSNSSVVGFNSSTLGVAEGSSSAGSSIVGSNSSIVRVCEGSNSSSLHDEPSSSQALEQALSVASLQARLRERERELVCQRRERETFLKELQESVVCPVCFSIPRAPPVPCCSNGHVICNKCKDKVDVCPTCRIAMTNCVSQVAATIIQRIEHPCDWREAGCQERCDISSIVSHEERCGYRQVRCPHWACDEQTALTSLTSHVISAECGDNYMAKPLPYQEEIEYTRALDDQDGNSFWRPSLLQFQNVTFYLQMEKCGKSKQWYFYVQMEGSEAECERFECRVSVCKFAASERHSIAYNGKVCPIDIKGAEELDNAGCGLNVRDAVMEKIFVVDTTEEERGRAKEGEKEEGEVGGEGEGERFKFWVRVDLSKAEAV